MYKKNPNGWKKHADFILLDLFSLEFAYFISYYIRHRDFALFQIADYRGLIIVLALLDVAAIFFLATMSGVLKRGLFQEFKKTLNNMLIVMMLTCVYLYLGQNGLDYSRMVIGGTALLYLVFSYLIRLGWKYVLKNFRGVSESQSLMLVAKWAQAEELVKDILAHNYEGYHICSIVILDEDESKDKEKQNSPCEAETQSAQVSPCEVETQPAQTIHSDLKNLPETLYNIPIIHGKKAAIAYASREWVDEVLLLTDAREEDATDLMTKFRQMGITVHMRLFYSEILMPEQYVEKLNGLTVLTSSTRYVTQRQLFYKRCLDIIGGLVGSLLTLILLVIIGPIIKIQSPGPILFKQIRVGRGGKKFTMYKLRSMYPDAEARKAELMKEHADRDSKMFKLEFDPRIIGCKMLPDGTIKKGIGNFIRDYSLDEFPQFFNVLKGDMSLVGTRPPTVDEWEQYELHHRSRLMIKPGITGKWQVSGRSNITDFEEVVKLDQEYIQEWNIGQDIKLILKTILSVVRKDGAM